MDMANFTIKMEECMMETGIKIKCKGMVNYIINLENLLIKDNGRMINLKEKVFYIMNNLIKYLEVQIIKILMILDSIG